MSYGGGNRSQGGSDRGYDDRRGHDNRGDRGYDNRGDRNYDNRSRGQDDRRDDRQYGSTYSTHSGSSSSGRGGRGGNYQGGGGRGGNYQDDLSGRMDNMNMGGGGRGGGGYRGGDRGGGNMYDQHSNRGGQSRVQRNDGASMGDLAGSAQHPNAPVPKKNLAHTKQTFFERPKESVYEKKTVGTKTELWTNHALVSLPEKTMKLWCYNVDVMENRKKVIKREEAGPLFHQILRDNRRTLSPSIKYIFNDVNMLWTTEQLPSAQATYVSRSKRSSFELKHCGRVDFGKETREEQDIQLLSTLVDAIATATARTSNKFIVFKRCMYMIQGATENPNEVLDFPITVPLRNGLDARVGISMAVRINLRAGITACYDVAHTIFTRPGYSLILLLCELINDGTIEQEEFENIWDQRLRSAVVTADNRKVMSAILKKMRLQYSFDAGVKVDEHGNVVEDPSLYAPLRSGKSFKFFELTDTASEHVFFDDRANRSYTVEEYFLKAKNIRLRYPNLPMLRKKPTKQNTKFIAFPMELITFENCKRFEGAMSTELKADLIKYTSYEAPQRFHLLEKIVGQQRIADVPPAINNKDEYMKATGLEIGTEMLSVKATILPPPTVVYGEGSTFKDVDHVGEWEAITHNPIRKVLEDSTYVRNKDPQAPKLKKRLIGSILEISSPKFGRNEMHYDSGCYHRLMCAIDNAGQPIAWENKEKGQAAIQGIHKYCQTNSASTPYSIVQFFESLKANIDDKYKESDDEVLIPFVLVIFEVRCSLVMQTLQEGFNDYNFMKYHGDNEKGIYTQGILLRNFSEIGEVPATCKLTRLLVEKVLGKIGTTHRKLERGGDFKPWTMFTNPEDPVLLLGVDVSHPSTAEREYQDIRKLSAAAVVGNIDFDCTEFRASCRIQQVGEERIVRFQEEIQARIHDFISHTGKRPNHIVMYRDGFSEGEFQRTLYEERLAIEQACVDTAPNWYPTVTYIVATKRHHTRFFLKDFTQGSEANGFNILPGTLVEDTVTTKEYYDFFLCSQVGEKGVARPTHYYVLHNSWEKLPVSFWPCITYALTYNFCRTTSTVAQPAPLLYAHLAAKRAKEALDGAWATSQMKHENLNVDNVANVNALTAAINVNKGLDGMIFV